MRLSALALLSSLSVLAGCSASFSNSAPSVTPAAAYSGRVHGGEQPVTGSTIQLYAVGTSGDGSAAAPLIGSTVTTDANGNFSITGLYSCSAATDVFLLATGGNPGLSAANPNLTLMAALGPCSALTPQTFISVNELTTVAAVYALAPFMSSTTHIGSASSDAAALDAAFALANSIVSSSTGAATGGSNAAQLNALADILAACVNSTGGSANDGSVCGKLFALTAYSATPPSDTVAALLNIAQNPNSNIQQLYQLIPAAAPYQPTLPSTPPDLALPLTPSANAAAGLHIGPSALAFPSTSAGITAPSQTIVISNPTTAPVALSGLTFTGANQADFAQTNNCGSTLAAFSTCTVAITFTPGANSARSASLSIASATPDSPQLVALAGSGVALALDGPRAVVDSPIVRIYPGASYDVNLSNTGNAALVISSIALAGTPYNTQTNNCPSSLTPGTSCTVSIQSLAPGADQLTILTNDAGFSSNILVLPSNTLTAIFAPSNVFFAGTALGTTNHYNYVYGADSVLAPVISGPQSPEFSTTAAVCTPGQYPSTSPNCSFTVTFAPLAAGLRSAKLALDASGNYLPLAGLGMSALPASGLNLPFFDFTQYPLPQSGGLYNNSASPVTFSNIAIQSIAGYSEFTQTNDCGSSVAPHSYCTVHVSSTRRAEGGTQALLTITEGTNVYTMTLDDSLSPVIDFGDTSYNTTPSGQHGSYPIQDAFNTTNYSSVFGGSIAQYPWTSYSFAGCSVNSGTCVAEINFNPTLPGLQVGIVSVLNNGPSYSFSNGPTDSDKQYILMGTGVATEPAAKLTLKQSGFTNLIGLPLLNQGALTLINPGSHTLTLTGPVLSGTSPEKFSLGQASCAQSSSTNSTFPTIAPGTVCTLPISFTGTQTAFSAATATVTDTTSGLTFSTPLYLDTLVGPTVSPSSLSFPPTGFYSVSPAQSVTVTRDISQPITSSTSGDLIAIKGACAAGEAPCILTFAFAPTSLTDSHSATIFNNTLGTSTTLPITATPEGIVVYSSGPVSARSVYFPSQIARTLSAPQSISLSSGGPNALDIYSMTLSGTNASEFSETSNCPATLPVSAGCTISFSFVPVTAGYKTATVTLKDSADPGEPVVITLSGTAQ